MNEGRMEGWKEGRKEGWKEGKESRRNKEHMKWCIGVKNWCLGRINEKEYLSEMGKESEREKERKREWEKKESESKRE